MNLLLAQQVTIRKPGLLVNFGVRAFAATALSTTTRFVPHLRHKALHAPVHHIKHHTRYHGTKKGIYWPFSQINSAARERSFLKEEPPIRTGTREGLLVL